MKGTNLMKTNERINNHGVHGVLRREEEALVSKPLSKKLRATPWLFFLPLILFALSCEQPFRAGLGSVVDVRPPTVTLDAPSPGSYIWGTRTFSGFAEDDYILETVQLRVTNHPEFVYYYDNDRKSLRPEEWIDVQKVDIGRLSKTLQNKGYWELEIDTSKFPDGDLKIQVKATDSQDRFAITEEILFTVRNVPPAITVAAPYIQFLSEIDPRDRQYLDDNGYLFEDIYDDYVVSGDTKMKELREKYAGSLGIGGRLNWNMGGGAQDLSASTFKRKLDIGSVISGTISYDEDIYLGSARTEITGSGDDQEEIEWYPPQIRVWSVDGPDNSFAPGNWPTVDEAPWRDLVYTGNQETDNLFPLGIGNYQFMWSLGSDEYESGYFYGFEVRALSKDGRSEFRYPRDYWYQPNPENWDNIPVTPDQALPDFLRENRYVLFYLKEQSAFPTIELYNFEDLSKWNSEQGRYDILPGYNDEMSHPFVNKDLVSKNGPFTLRLKASHPDGIGSAEVYWEKDDKSMRGRFIWDAQSSTALTADVYYSQWGVRAPFAGDPARNFVFTYTDGGNDRVPGGSVYHPLVRGRSQIQRYTGGVPEWDKGKREGFWPQRTSDPTFVDMATLDEGVYNLEIYARTSALPTGEVKYNPFPLTIRIDRTPPTAEIVTIDGVDPDPEVLNLAAGTATVNGVIEPRLSFSDSRVEDSGLRTATEDYYKQGAVFGPEQRWLLVKDDSKQMETHIAAKNAEAGKPVYWPEMPGAGGDITIAGVGNQITVVKHGAVSNSRFKFRTSKIYAAADNVDEDDYLPDGKYYLYIFVRDNAYNTGYTSIEINVLESSDNPVIDFLGEIKGTVTDANFSAENTPTGFLGNTRNNLGPSTNIRLKLRDDDSLDLDPANVKITFNAGTPANADGNNITLVNATGITVPNVFGQHESGNVNGKQVIRTREGTIRQSELLTLLKANSAYSSLFTPKGGAANYTNGLPDGIYRLSIEIGDYGYAKLTMPDDPEWRSDPDDPTSLAVPGEPVPQSVKNTINFWFYVDTTDPEITITDTGTDSIDGWITPTGGLSAFRDKNNNQLPANARDGVVFAGTVSDVNGPITVSNFVIRNEENDYPSSWAGTTYTTASEVKISYGAAASTAPDPVIPATPSSAALPWNAQFQAPVHINPNIAATYVVTLEIKDRFGRVRTVVQRYSLDREKPKVSLQRDIDSFERKGFANDRLASPTNPPLNPVPPAMPFGDARRDNLTNGIVYFQISATDDVKVDGVKWWLLPEATTFGGFSHPAVSAAAATPPPTALLPNNGNGVAVAGGASGFKTSNFSERTYIDTKLMNRGVYKLYVMAKDSAGNVSESTAALQTICVWEEEDAPYFEPSNLTDGGVVDKDEMILSITITDDDGFFAGNPSVLQAGTIKLWVNNTGSPTDRGTYNPTTGVWTAVPSGYAPFAAGNANVPTTLNVNGTNKTLISAMGTKIVTLNLNLNDVPDTAFKAKVAGDGVKHFIIEVTDSPADKFSITGGAVTETKSWREYYTMTVDSSPPVVTLNFNPAPDASEIKAFGTDPTGFNITTTISDTYLKPIPTGNTGAGQYFVKVLLDGTQIAEYYSLGVNSTPAQTTVGPININNFFGTSTTSNTYTTRYENLTKGYHTLTFVAEDQSGKTGSAAIGFTKDLDPPKLTFTTTGFNVNTPMPNINNRDWWAATSNTSTGTNDYLTKRNTALPVVTYDPGSADDIPFIEGTFSDESSNIDFTVPNSTFYIQLDGGPRIRINNIRTSPVEPGIQTPVAGTPSKDVTWKVYLTKNGTRDNLTGASPSNAILIDGVHSIQLEVADVLGNVMPMSAKYGFRVISKTPTATLTKPTKTVYGDRTGLGAGDTVFTITGQVSGYNLANSPVELVIRYNGPDSGNYPAITRAPTSGSFVVPFIVDDELNNAPGGTGTGTGRENVTENYNWSLTVTRQHILDAGNSTGTMRGGTYEIMAVAVDRSTPTAKKSEETTANVWQFFVDFKKPDFSFTLNYNTTYTANPAVGDTRSVTPVYYLTNATTLQERNVISATDESGVQTARLKGSVTDDNELKDVQIQISKWNYAAANQTDGSAWQLYNRTTSTNPPATPTFTNWTDTLAGNDGYWITLPVPVATPPTKSYTLNFDLRTLNLPDGYYRVRMRARDASTAATTSTGWGTANDGNPAYSHCAFFFYDNNIPVVTPNEAGEPFYATRYVTSPANYAVPLQVTFSDLNMFEKVEISVRALHTGSPAVVPTITNITNLRSGSGTWTNQAVNVPFNPTNLADGSYMVTFTATDLAGKTATNTRTITLDNSPPTAAVAEPRDPVDGGLAFAVTGSTGDSPVNGSASEPGGIWYRIGYGTQTALPTLASTLTPAQRSAEIMAWAATADSGLVDVPTTGNRDTGAAYNANFDTASRRDRTNGSLWFKYIETTANSTYDVPAGFSNITRPSTQTTLDLYNWTLNATNTVAANYAIGTQTAGTRVTMRNRNYDKGIDAANANRALARPLSDSRSTHSLPLVVRVVDKAGNVFYEIYDIRLNPYADNPKSVINNTAERFLNMEAARGGQIQINGVAKDNVGVRTVIYRVKADNTQNTAAGNAPTDANIVTITGATAVNNTILNVWNTRYGAANVTGGGVTDYTNQLSQTGWYVATLESPSSATSSWNFMLNSGGEITSAIASRGFRHAPGTGPNDMIRVWVEVLVFDELNSNYNLMSLGDAIPRSGDQADWPIDADKPRPYIREFFFTSSAPSVSNRQIWTAGGTTFENYGQDVTPSPVPPVAENYIRGGRFAVRARLNSGGTDGIGQIQIRLAGESTNNSWTTVYDGSTITLPTGLTLTNTDGTTFTGNSGAATTAVLTYQFDSTTASPAAGFRSVRNGTWATSGGKFTVEVNVRNGITPSSEDSYTFEIGVDNFAPLADTKVKITPSKVAGSDVTFLGRVFDYSGSPDASTLTPPYNGIKEVRAWFTDWTNTNYLNMNDVNNTTGIQISTASAAQKESRASVYKNRAYNVAYNGEIVTNIAIDSAATPAPTTGAQELPLQADYVVVINGGGGWSPTTGTADVSWNFTVNTANLKPDDGWVKMHYIVIDNAGNTSYYSQDMIVMNNTPQITEIRLYTNNTGEGAVFTTHEGNEAYSDYVMPNSGGVNTPYPTGYLDSGFIAKNRIIGFGVTTIKGNAPMYYQARYVERYRIPLNNANLQVMAKRTAGTSTTTDYLQYYNDAGALITGDNTDAQGRLSVNSFVNLYTIVSGDGMTAREWQTLGVPAAEPSSGSHFIFQGVLGGGGDNDVTNTTKYAAVYVYAYREMKAIAEVQRTSPNHNSIPVVAGEASLLSFSGNAFDGIPEAQATSAANAASGSAGTAYFLITVRDTVDHRLNADGTTNANVPTTLNVAKDMLYDAIVIGMKVYVGDNRAPYARLYDLNPYLENAVNGYNSTDDFRAATLNAAADPTEIGENIKRGGLYNIGTERAPIKSGYIDPRYGANAAAGSTALNPYVNYPDDPLNPYLGSLQERSNGFVTGSTDSVGTNNTISRDQVSGKIILRGLAWDDQLIDEIRINIGVAAPSATTGTLIAKLKYVNKATGVVVDSPSQTDINNGTVIRKMVPEANAWVYEQIHWQSGHTVEWAYLWDTETVPSGRTVAGGPLADVRVALIVVDYNGTKLPNNARTVAGTATAANSSTVAGVTAANNQTDFHNTLRVDIKPYVTGLKRAEPAYSTTRSRQGWYSFFQGEAGIRVQGYNLGTAALTINRSSTNTADTAGDITGTVVGTPPNHEHTFALTGTPASGRLRVYVGTRTAGTEAWNNTSVHATKSWNKEHSPYIEGSDLWTNKLYAHIWRAQSGDYFAQSGGVETPGMALQFVGANAGRLHAAWANSGEDSVFYTHSNMAARRLMVKAGEPYSGTDIDFANVSTAANTPANDTSTANSTTGDNTSNYASVVMARQADGHPLLRLRARVNYQANADWGGLGDRTTAIIGPHIDPSATNRWQNARIVKAALSTADNNAGRVYVSAYDAMYQRLFFTVRNAAMTLPSSNANSDTSENAEPRFLDGTSATGIDTAANISAAVNNQTVGGTTIARAAVAGEYSAIDFDNAGYPVIAYYDQSNDTLRIAYANTQTPTAGNNWTRRYVLPSTDPLFRGSGTHVSIKIQRGNNNAANTIIHLAFFNSVKNTLVYATATRAQMANGTAFTAYTVDNVVKGGMYTDISLDSTNRPWIVYADSVRIGNNGGARIAYLDPAYTRPLLDPVYGTPAHDNRSIAGWEALSMPAPFNVNRDRLNIEAWPPHIPNGVTQGNGNSTTAPTWNAAVGYGSDYFRLGYFTKPAAALLTGL